MRTEWFMISYAYLCELIGEPEVTMNLNEGSVPLPFHPLEEPEEDMFEYETDTALQDTNTESEVNSPMQEECILAVR